MDKLTENHTAEKSTAPTNAKSGRKVASWYPASIPGRKPLLSGKTKFTVTPSVRWPSEHYQEQ